MIGVQYNLVVTPPLVNINFSSTRSNRPYKNSTSPNDGSLVKSGFISVSQVLQKTVDELSWDEP